MTIKLLLVAAATVAGLGVTVAPALATNARQAMAMCDLRPGCDYRVDSGGWVTIYVDGHGIECPPGDDDDCFIIWRKATSADFKVKPTGATSDPGSGNHGDHHGGGNDSTGNGGGNGGGRHLGDLGGSKITTAGNTTNVGNGGKQAIGMH